MVLCWLSLTLSAVIILQLALVSLPAELGGFASFPAEMLKMIKMLMMVIMMMIMMLMTVAIMLMMMRMLRMGDNEDGKFC